ncbi:hypothetical protein XAP412_1190067 [Xanthomonas phaseoli pv. phaseoli]|uniref:Uncharacterized protein n=1 Tax=Xanthomonas campestris pv. phaseoli TaxID=317013 RepID=A0AB38DVC4_XANCH|nr:hypothetical protein XAP6984_1230068 [Xanthomonas phaseoli pv. phaseoli]SON76953.1 hypothetical protein XAP412_1190067 [Xanthomonas phaseoli pv. phaseoli]SON81888.1 hypothetical protein XAP7430_1200068 [Xanthomonas phaseoli pv. phaseoli]
MVEAAVMRSYAAGTLPSSRCGAGQCLSVGAFYRALKLQARQKAANGRLASGVPGPLTSCGR